ncbi:MAG: protein kinase domain-containing protein, partial [Byssovorax sp.]
MRHLVSPEKITGVGGSLSRDPADEATAKFELEDQPMVPSGRQEPIQVGATVDNHKLVRLLGRGGMGEVWLASDVRLDRLVALKFLHATRVWQTQHFMSEARVTARLTHENIVSLYDVGEHAGTLYMVLEYVRGRSLRQWQASRATATDGSEASVAVPPREVVDLMVPALRALVHAHEAGVVHCDLKLANVMLTDTGAVKVLDFGIARLMAGARSADDGRSSGDSSSISAASLVGTPSYMSPEQLSGAPVDPRTDIWAVGIMMHVLALGRHPLGTLDGPPSTDDLVSLADVTVPMPSVRERHPELGRLATLIDRCLIKLREDRIGSARELLAELEGTLSSNRSVQADDGAPYSGLAAFQEGDAGRFFGRERAVRQAVARLAEQPLLAVIGPSGSGKSSFVRAGLVPALKRGDDVWQGLVFRPGSRPLTALAELLLRLERDGSDDGAPATTNRESRELISISGCGVGVREALWLRLEAAPDHLGKLLRARARRRRERIVLFCDQLEEAFTLAEAGERATFLACLRGVANDARSPVRVVVSMRSDFLDRLTEEPAMAELVGPAVFLLGSMTRDELRMALVEPARLADHEFESEAMVVEMLDALPGTAGALPLLQFTAAMLWESRDQQRRVLTLESYRRMGGVAGALASHADAVLASLSSKEKRAARAVLLRLVTPERTRALVPLSELAELPGAARKDIQRVVARLVDARLVSIETEDEREDKTVELVHESLIERWAKLRAWLDEDQHDAQFLAELRSAAAQWQKNGRAEGLLWRDEAAHRARAWLEGRRAAGRDGIVGKELGYLEAVIGLSERTKKLRQRIVAGLFSLTVLVSIVVGVLAIGAREQARTANKEMARADEQARRAEEQARQAQEEARHARNATRMAAGAREIQHDPTTVLSLLREIEPGSVPQGWASLALWARGAGVARLVLHHDEEVTAAAFSPDGKRIVSASRDGVLRIWSVDGQGAPLVLKGDEHRITSVAFSPDGRRVVFGSWDNTVRVWDAEGQSPPLILRGHDNQVTSAAFSPDGKRIVSGSHDKTVRVWDARGQGAPLVLKGHDEGVYSVGFSPDGKRIVSGSHDRTLRVWDAGGQGAPLVLKGHESSVTSVAFSPDGKRIVSASRDQTVRVWDANGEGKPIVLAGHRNVVWSAAFSR